ncbi:PAS domain S-box [Wenxinia marina DSM 24838]|uniref:histidine kinase n=2 Tax=Wenxinia TaxID=653686 RepID=A0A0D0QJU1_9RHOB|nr:PAS domain S-box [Wenxinia marina DSM 24838]
MAEAPVRLERLERAMRAAEIGVWDWDLVTDAFDYSPSARDIFGLPPEGRLSIEDIRALVHPEDSEATRAATGRVLDPLLRSTETYTYRIRRGDTGDRRWIRARGLAEFSGDGPDARAVRFTGTVEDITEAEETRRALAISEARLRIALDAAAMAVWDLDIESDTLVAGPELKRLYGFPEDSDPTPADLRATYAPGEAERLERENAEAMARGDTSIQTRVRHVLGDGTERVLTVRAALAPDDGSGRRRAIGVVFDVTDQVANEERLATIARELRHRMKNMVTMAGVLAGRTWPRDEAHATYVDRLRAMGASADLMFGAEDGLSVPLVDIVDRILAPFRRPGSDGIAMDGPDMTLPERTASGLAMVLHELGTNATKHGALSRNGGEVRVAWRETPRGLRLHWTERGGPTVCPPAGDGFGMVLLRRAALPSPHEVSVTFDPAGLSATIDVVLQPM